MLDFHITIMDNLAELDLELNSGEREVKKPFVTGGASEVMSVDELLNMTWSSSYMIMTIHLKSGSVTWTPMATRTRSRLL